MIQFDNAGSGSDVDGTNDSWSVSKTGVAILEELTIDGTEGSNVFTVTKGDTRLLDGALAVTDDDNAASFTVTNNTATTASVVVLAGSGVFSGSTTTSFMTITPSGLTTGTAVYLPVAGLTEGKALHIVGNAVTSGILVHVSSSAATTQLTGAGRLMLLEHSGNASGTGTVAEMSTAAADETVLLKLTASGALALGTVLQVSGSSVTTGTAISAADFDALTTGMGLSLASTSTGLTTGSMLRISTGTTGAVATNGVVSITATAAYTSTSNCGLLQVVANSVTTGATVLNVSATAATTSVVARFASTGTGLTSGSVILATTGTTGAIATNGAFSFVGSGDFTVGAVGVGLLHVGATATTAGTIASVAGTALTTGVALHLASTGTGMTSGSLLRMTTGTTGAVATNGICSIRATGAYTSTAFAGLLDVIASATTGGTVCRIKSDSLVDGELLHLQAVEATLTTGKYIACYDGAANDFSVAKYGATIIAGNASGTDALTLTAGDVKLTAGNLTLTDGDLTLTDGFIRGTAQAIVNANTAIDVTHLVTTIANNAGSTHTLADGVTGQIKIIDCVTYTGDAVITPTNFVGSTITLNAAGDTWTGIFNGTEWRTLAVGGTAAVA